MAVVKQNDLYLTELILAIQNEVQSAVDYIADVAARSGTELGKSSAVMNIENLRVKLPFIIELEKKPATLRPLLESGTGIELLRKNLANRKGLLLEDTGKPGKMAIYTKVRILQAGGTAPSPSPQEGQAVIDKGEIEIIFAPVRRE